MGLGEGNGSQPTFQCLWAWGWADLSVLLWSLSSSSPSHVSNAITVIQHFSHGGSWIPNVIRQHGRALIRMNELGRLSCAQGHLPSPPPTRPLTPEHWSGGSLPGWGLGKEQSPGHLISLPRDGTGHFPGCRSPLWLPIGLDRKAARPEPAGPLMAHLSASSLSTLFPISSAPISPWP